MSLERYRLLAQRGAGPDGESYRAQRDGSRCEVRLLATARATPERWRHVVKRLKLGALLEHSIALRFLEVQFDQDPPFMALEEAPAEKLGALAKQLPWPVEKLLKVARDLAACLAAAHRIGLMHGGLEPAN